MNVLVFSGVEWSDENSYGNTLSNWFDQQENMNFSCIYRRNSDPDNDVCHDYYRITFTSILKNVITPQRIGCHFQTDIADKKPAKDGNIGKSSDSFEKKIISFIKKHNLKFVYAVQKFSFQTGLWNNRKFKDYIAEFAPDIVFTTITYCEESEWIIREILKQRPQCKFVGFLADDVYGAAPSPKAEKNIKAQIDMASYLYGISEELCNAYADIFQKEFHLLYKGCEFDAMNRFVNKPLRLVYAGNLFFGRDEILGRIAQHLKSINSRGVKAVLEIYTGAVIDAEISEKLNISGTSQIMGSRPYSEIKKIMNQADFVLEVESFDQKQIDLVRYSFSTKITDCLQSGSVPLAIGPAGIASIEYVRKIPGAHVIDDLDQMEEQLETLLASGDRLMSDAETVREFAVKHHDLDAIRNGIRKDFEGLLN